MDLSLLDFLKDELAEKASDLAPSEIITEAVVLFRVQDMSDGGERYRYTVSRNVTLAHAIGILELTKTTMMHYYNSVLDAEEDEDDD